MSHLLPTGLPRGLRVFYLALFSCQHGYQRLPALLPSLLLADLSGELVASDTPRDWFLRLIHETREDAPRKFNLDWNPDSTATLAFWEEFNSEEDFRLCNRGRE